VTGGRGSPPPRQAAASAASSARRAEAPRPGCEDVLRVVPLGGPHKPARDDACHNYGRVGHWAKDYRQP
jgi:hypothetical protein